MRDENKKTGYMCGVDWQHHVGYDSKGTAVYPSVEALKRHAHCWESCGIVRVSLEEVHWVVLQDFDREVNRDRHDGLKREALVQYWTRWLEQMLDTTEGREDLDLVFATNPKLLERAKRIFGVS